MPSKLLVIDDQPGVAKVLALIADGLGFETRVLTCPFQAIDAFMDMRPDVVILDMIMPEKDGIDVLHELMLTGVPCRIILTTGLSDAYLRLAEGIANFYGREVTVLRKPFRREEIVALLLAAEAKAGRRKRPELVVCA